MQVGRFTIEQLNEGQFELFPDGKINRTPVSEKTGRRAFLKDRNSLVGINPLYITDGSNHILVDAGLGWGLDTGSAHADVSNVRTNLDIFGVTPGDITHVILTHLHYDHAAGISFTGNDTTTQPVFPNAKLMVQKQEWNFAVDQVQHQGMHSKFYRLDDFYRLYADNLFVFVDTKQEEIIPGITVIKTGGHTAGHQVIKITDQKETAYFLGDLLSTSRELNHFNVAHLDMNRVQAKKMKVQLLRQVYNETAYLYFYHELSSKPCRLKKDEENNYIAEEL